MLRVNQSPRRGPELNEAQVSHFLAWAVILPISFAFLIPGIYKAFGQSRRPIEYLFVAALLSEVFITLEIAREVREYGRLVYFFSGWPPPLGIAYVADALSATFLLLAALLTAVAGVFTTWYTRFLHGKDPYVYSFMLSFMTGIAGVFLTADLFNMYVMIELMSISAYALVVLRGGRALAAGLKYALYSGLFAVVLAFSSMMVYGGLGSLSFGDFLIAASKGVLSHYVVVGTVGIFWGAAFLAAVFPNHFWLPDAHSEAISPASALLSGVAVTSGIYVIARLSYTILPSALVVRDLIMPSLGFFGVIGALYASFLMLISRDVKRILAYSTVLNISYVVISMSLMNGDGLLASVVHSINHAVGKTLAFMAIGVFVRFAGTRDIDGLAGEGNKAPLVFLALTTSFINLIGLPPFGGFFSKLLLYQSFVGTGNYVAAAVLLASSVIAALSYLRVLERLWVHPVSSDLTKRRSIAIKVSAVLLLLMSVQVLLGFFSGEMSSLVRLAVSHGVSGHEYSLVLSPTM